MRISTSIASALVLAATACSSAPTDNGVSSSSAVSGFPGCSGSFNTNPSPTGAYYATDFGCSSNPYFTDPGDTCGSAACIQSAYDEGVCTSSQSNATCQRTVNWYAVGGASYGCGARLQVTNPSNGKSVIVMVLDNGPSCNVENDANFWVLDVSYPTIQYLFGSEEGWADHALINAVVVDTSTPLGPTDGSSPPPPPPDDAGTGDDGSSGDDASSGDCTLGGHGYGQNTCTETLQCDNGAWVDRDSDPSDCNTGVESKGACITDSGSVVPENTCTSTLQCDNGVWVDRDNDPAACL
jgi:hypothetical protein